MSIVSLHGFASVPIDQEIPRTSELTIVCPNKRGSLSVDSPFKNTADIEKVDYLRSAWSRTFVRQTLNVDSPMYTQIILI